MPSFVLGPAVGVAVRAAGAGRWSVPEVSVVPVVPFGGRVHVGWVVAERLAFGEGLCYDETMKKFLTVLACSFLFSVSVSAAETLFPVSALPTEWVTGSAPMAWAPGELTVIECWATWCGPCVSAIPHVEKLNQQLKGEGIHFIGVNVGDRKDPEALRAFLSKLRVPPTYPMVIDKTRKINSTIPFQGIPFCFAVREGKVVWKGHPMRLSPELLRALRDGQPLPQN